MSRKGFLFYGQNGFTIQSKLNHNSAPNWHSLSHASILKQNVVNLLVHAFDDTPRTHIHCFDVYSHAMQHDTQGIYYVGYPPRNALIQYGMNCILH